MMKHVSTPGSALVGYAILRANYNAQAPSYLDNFAPFVLAAIAGAKSAIVERNSVSTLIREQFGLNIPALVLPRLLRRTHKQGLTEAVGSDAVRLTAKSANELPDLSAEVAQYQSRQNELVAQLGAFIETEYPEHIELTTRDLGRHLAEFFDKNAVPLLGASLRSSQLATTEGAGIEYVVAAFVQHLHLNDQARFTYVVEAAKGAMLASVLELDTSSMSDSLGQLTLVMDSPVLMDALGYHGDVLETAMRHVFQMAKSQGATLGVFRHTLSELEGILHGIESALRFGSASRSTSPGYLHFAESGASPVDIALLREQLESEMLDLGVVILEPPGGFLEYGLDESKLEEAIQSRVRYLQDAARVNDVRSISAVHRMRKGNQSTTIERCGAVFISSNGNLVRGASDFTQRQGFPLAVTAEAVASILWVRSPALADDVPREVVLASAYAGMQPSPILWKRYIDEVERLETAGSVSPDDAVILRATSVGRDAFMAETLGDETALAASLPLVVLERVQASIEQSLQQELSELGARLNDAEALARVSDQEKQLEADARQLAQGEAAANKEQMSTLQSQIDQLNAREIARAKRIRESAISFVHKWSVFLTWAVRGLLILGSGGLIWLISSDASYPFGSLTWVLAVVGVLGVLASFLPQVRSFFEGLEGMWGERRVHSSLLKAGLVLDELASDLIHHEV